MPSNYTNCINIEQALYFDLFDDIPYKWLKLILDPSIDREEWDFEVEIEDIPVEKEVDIAFITSPCRTTFTFDLKLVDDVRFGQTYYKTKTFTKTIDYGGSSGFAMTLCGMKEEDEDTEEEEEEDEGNTEDYMCCCVNLHLGGQYGCDLCCDLKDKDNPEMMKEWLDKNNNYHYKLHKKWLDDNKTS